MINSFPTTKNQKRIQYELDLQKRFRRLIRRDYDKQFKQKHNVPRRKGREDYVLLLKFVHQFFISGEFDYQEAVSLAEPLFIRIKGLHATQSIKKQEFEQALLILHDLRESIAEKFRIGG